MRFAERFTSPQGLREPLVLLNNPLSPGLGLMAASWDGCSFSLLSCCSQVCSEQKLYCKEWRRRKRMVMVMPLSGAGGQCRGGGSDSPAVALAPCRGHGVCWAVEWSGFPPLQSQVRRPWVIAVAVELGVLCRLRSVLPPGPWGFGEGSWVPR